MKKTIIVIIACILGITQTAQVNQQSINMSDTGHSITFAANLQDMYSVFITKDVNQCKEFYKEWFRFTVIFESSWFILLQAPGEKGMMLAFMNEEHPSSPPNPKAMNGDGAFLTFQVADAKQVYDAMVEAGKKIDYQLKDEDWGQRRFALIDPNGMHVDVVEQIAAKEGFWEQYMK